MLFYLKARVNATRILEFHQTKLEKLSRGLQ
jgi:hypothetical protein